MMILKYIFTVIILLSTANHSFCFFQNDNLKNSISDSTDFEIINSEFGKLEEFKALKIADSLKKAELERQIMELKAADISRKQNLLNELDSIKNSQEERFKKMSREIDSLKEFVKGFPVVLGTDTLFLIYAKAGVITPKTRAELINSRILNLAKEYFFKPDSIKIIKTEPYTFLTYGEMLILNVSYEDALWVNSTPDNLAVLYRSKIIEAIDKYKKATSFETRLKEIGLSLLVIAILSLLIYMLVRFFRWIGSRIQKEKDIRIKGLKFKNYELIDSSRQINFLLIILKLLKWLTIILFIYLTLPVLFIIFPGTEPFADTLIGWIINPLNKIISAVWNYLPNLFTIIVIVFVFRYALKAIKFLKNEIVRGALKIPGFYPDWANPTFQIVRVLILAFMLVVIFPYLPGSDSPVFQGISVFLGVLFTFGSSGSLSNIIAGFVLTYMRAFRIGDRVNIGEVTGDIIEKSPLVTRIRTIKNEIISIPNSNVMNSHTINYSLEAEERGLIIHTTITIGYDAPWRKVHQLLKDAALATEYILKDPEPYVLQTSLNDFYVSYEINAFTRESKKQADIYSKLHQNIQDKFNEGGVEIMSPHYKSIRDGNTTTIPSDYLPENYEAPVFKIKDKE